MLKRTNESLGLIDKMETELKPGALTEKVDALLASIVGIVAERQEELKTMNLRHATQIMSRVVGVKVALSRVAEGSGAPVDFETWLKEALAAERDGDF